MDKAQIIEVLAKERRVERMVENITHRHTLSPELKDLAQMVYLILLDYDAERIVELWNGNEIDFFLCRIILNQYRSVNSPFHYIYRIYQARSTDLTDKDWTDGD